VVRWFGGSGRPVGIGGLSEGYFVNCTTSAAVDVFVNSDLELVWRIRAVYPGSDFFSIPDHGSELTPSRITDPN
jgi:hypothetical protein